MICKKCKKDIPEGAPFCCWCGKPQERQRQRTHRRAKGTGTIRKDSRYASPWIAIAPPLVKGTHGRYLGTFKTRAEAQQALDLYHAEAFPELYNVPLEKIYELWSENHYPTLSDSGIQGYKAAYKSISELSNRKFRELKTADFQRCVDVQAAKGASYSKLAKIRQLCSQLCKYALQNDLITKNYAEFIRLPKNETKEKQIFTAADRAILWQHTDDKRVQIILVMIYTGFRVGEIIALRSSDVHQSYMQGGEKTEAGKNRIVPFPRRIPEIKQFVDGWTRESSAETILGVTAEYFRKYMFYPCLAELGLISPPVKSEKTGKDMYIDPRLTPHSTRHTFASLSASAHMPPEILQKIIGHADYSTTADIYIHENLDDLIEGMGQIER